MNLENIYQGIKNQWLNLKFERDEEKDGILRFQESANLGGVEDDILITINVTNHVHRFYLRLFRFKYRCF